MESKKNINLEYLEIKSTKDLNESIIFLEQSFKWGKKKSDLLRRRLPIINKNINSYGFMNKTIKKPNPYFQFFLANLMNIIPPLRTCFGFNKTNIYCCFKKKL